MSGTEGLSRRWLLLGGALVLAGCGKRGAPRPPAGEAAAYTYPSVYPAPASQVPWRDPEVGSSSREEVDYDDDTNLFERLTEDEPGDPFAPTVDNTE